MPQRTHTKFFSAIFFALFFASGTAKAQTGSASAVHFTDLPETHPHFFAVYELSRAGVLKGFEDGTFRPDQPVTRAEAVKILLTATGSPAPAQVTESGFSDVSGSVWYVPYVAHASKKSLVQGYTDGTFRPNAPIIYVEALPMAMKSFGVSAGPYTGSSAPVVPGIPGDQWYSEYAAYARDALLLDPPDDGVMVPTHAVTRGEFSEMAYRMNWIKEKKAKSFDLSLAWRTFFKPANSYSLKYPLTWFVHEGSVNSTFWKPDYLREQVWYTRLYPNSGRLSVSSVERKNMTSTQYFQDVKDVNAELGKNSAKYESLTVSGRPALRVTDDADRTMDLHISLPSNFFLTMYGEYGNGELSWFLKRQIMAMFESIAVVGSGDPAPADALSLEDRAERARTLVLVEGKGQEALDLFPDKALLETDEIGAGNGPVDYFWSAQANITLKFERKSNVILGVREGKTTEF